jgi:hypothetical protein
VFRIVHCHNGSTGEEYVVASDGLSPRDFLLPGFAIKSTMRVKNQLPEGFPKNTMLKPDKQFKFKTNLSI